MFEIGTKKLTLKCIALMMLVAGLLLFSNDSTKALLVSSQTPQGRVPLPTISVAAQADAPLRIISTSVESADPQRFELQLTMQNQSDKKIRAYALTSENSTDKNQSRKVEFVNLTRQSIIWQPTQIRTMLIGDAQNEPLVNIKLDVDFVEFTDGSTWGPDAHNSNDRLAGQRAGARAEKQRIRQLLKEKRQSAVNDSIEAIASAEIEARGDATRSEEWLDGFRNGVNSIRHRLKKALQAGGSTQLELELEKPYDSSEENQK